MPNIFARVARRTSFVAALAAIATMSVPQSGYADPICSPITAAALTIGMVDCTKSHIWSDLQSTGAFPDVFAGAGKKAPLCYKAVAAAPAFIGSVPVKISSESGWTTDFLPLPLGGTDNIGTVVTAITVADSRGLPIGQIFTRDTIDLSQIATGKSSEEDVVVGGAGLLWGLKGTYRITAIPLDAQLMNIALTNLKGVVCSGL